MHVSELLQRWNELQPRRALGGLYALAGFDFQLRVAVADLTEGLAEGGDDLKSAGQVFVEALSDQFKGDLANGVCIQVKRTLDRAALRSAASEIAAIDAFLSTEAPDLARSVY